MDRDNPCCPSSPRNRDAPTSLQQLVDRLGGRSVSHSRLGHGPIGHSAVTFWLWLVLIQQVAPFAGTAEFLRKNMNLLGALGAIRPLDRSYSNERGAVHMSKIGRNIPIYLQWAPGMNLHETSL